MSQVGIGHVREDPFVRHYFCICSWAVRFRGRTGDSVLWMSASRKDLERNYIMKAQPRILTVFAVCLFAAVAAHAGVTVTVSSPANNAGVPTSFNVVASATTDNPGAHVTGWYVYVDSVSNWHTPTG